MAGRPVAFDADVVLSVADVALAQSADAHERAVRLARRLRAERTPVILAAPAYAECVARVTDDNLYRAFVHVAFGRAAADLAGDWWHRWLDANSHRWSEEEKRCAKCIKSDVQILAVAVSLRVGSLYTFDRPLRERLVPFLQREGVDLHGVVVVEPPPVESYAEAPSGGEQVPLFRMVAEGKR